MLLIFTCYNKQCCSKKVFHQNAEISCSYSASLWFFPFHSFLFDVNSQDHRYYKNLVKCLRGDGLGANPKGDNSEASTSGGTQKRKRKSRWDPTPPKPASSSSSSSNSDAVVAAALAVAAEIEHSIPMSNKEEEERQKQIKEQQEVN